MIRALSHIVSGGVDLLEAEGRLARVHLVRIGALAATLLACSLLVTLSLVGVAAGGVILLAEEVGLGPALIWIGLGLLLLSLIVAVTAWSGLGRE